VNFVYGDYVISRCRKKGRESGHCGRFADDIWADEIREEVPKVSGEDPQV
jgi:hypothetical protein